MIGDHRFSATDARTTLAQALDLLDLYPPAAIERQGPRRSRIAAAVASVDGDDPESIAGALDVVWRELLTSRDDLVESGALPRPATGVVERVSISDGGVPKQAVARADIGFGGLAGDRQQTRLHHGRPWQAVCLWSSEVIAALAAAGHPIAAGNAGENVTVAGLPWNEVRPGVQLLVGTARMQVSAFALPCRKNARWFSDLDFTRIHHRQGPVSRVYATVLEPGVVAVGDAVVLEPG